MKNLGIKVAISRLENNGIEVNNYIENDKLCGYELNTYTQLGVNMIIFVDFRNTDKNPKSGKDFIELYNERVKSIDIEEEIGYLRQDKSYMSTIGTEVGYQDLKEWKETLLNIFVKKTAQQTQFEQTVYKLRSQLVEMEETLKLIPRKGNNPRECQRINISNLLGGLRYTIDNITLEDFIPNEYSEEFKLSYS